MTLTRRHLLRTVTGSAAAAALFEAPLAARLFASPEPQRPSSSGGFVFLGSNENAYGPLPSAVRAMQDAVGSRSYRYPYPMYEPLESRIASYHSVKREQVAFASGSTEPLRMAAQVFCGRGRNVVLADPTFEGLTHFAEACGSEIRKVPLTSSFAHDLERMLERVDSNTALVYVCNPNNPTGSITPARALATFLGRLPGHVVTLVDEAYHHCAEGLPGYRSLMDHAGDRVIVLRTFSKIYGMAGLRLGYAIASSAVIQKLLEHRLPISVNAVAAAGGLASLDDDAGMRFAVQRNAADREEFARQAAARNISFVPSFTNFYMLKVGRPATELIAAFEQNKVIVGRPFPPMNDWIRVSLGLPEENKAFWNVWDQLYG